MKKWFKMIFATFMLCMVVACGSKEATTTTLVGDFDGINYSIILDAEGDKVTQLTQITTMDLSGYDEETISLLEESIKEYETIYSEYDCATYTTELSDVEFKETITFDLSKPDYINELAEAGVLPLENDEKVAYISLKESIANYEELGMVKQ